MLYLYIVGVAIPIVAGIISLCMGIGYWLLLGLTALATAMIAILDGITAGCARSLPAKFADETKKIFIVSAKEKKFYEKLKIRKWKDKVPEIGHLTGFRKNKIDDPKSIEYLNRFLLESCYGQIGHFFSCIFGFIIFAFFFISPIWWAVCIPVSVINIFLNLPSLIILRYNSYKLRILRDSNLKKMQKIENKEV